MATPVITVTAGGIAVIETATGMAVTEAANARGIAVTKVVGKPYGMAVKYVSETGGPVTPSGPPLDAVAGVTGAWSFSRNMLTGFGAGIRYTKTGTAITAVNDQSGNSRHFTDGGNATHRPAETIAFPNSILCADFDGMGNALGCSFTLSNFITASSGAIVASVIVDAVTANTVLYNNHGIIADNGFVGLFASALSGMTLYSYNWDGNADGASAPGTVGTACVLMWRHHGGSIYFSINGGTEVVTASGNTSDLSQFLFMGTGPAIAANIKLAEAFVTNDGSQTAAFAATIANMKSWIGA